MSWRLKTRNDPRNRLSGARWWMGATIVAAGALVGAYLLDPENGHGRRTRIAERTDTRSGGPASESRGNSDSRASR